MYMHLHECIYMYTCIHIYAHSGKHLCAHTRMCMHMHSCTRICMHIQVCTYVHTVHWACLQGKSCCELGKHPSGCWVAISCAPPPLSHPLLRVSLPFPRKIQPWGGEGHTHTPPAIIIISAHPRAGMFGHCSPNCQALSSWQPNSYLIDRLRHLSASLPPPIAVGLPPGR